MRAIRVKRKSMLDPLIIFRQWGSALFTHTKPIQVILLSSCPFFFLCAFRVHWLDEQASPCWNPTLSPPYTHFLSSCFPCNLPACLHQLCPNAQHLHPLHSDIRIIRTAYSVICVSNWCAPGPGFRAVTHDSTRKKPRPSVPETSSIPVLIGNRKIC